MKECCTEQLLALYVEDDLPEALMERIHVHLADCEECRGMAAELNETQTAFKTIRQDIAPASAGALVRERVMHEVMRPTPADWRLRLERALCGIRWRYALCGVAVIALIGATFWEFRSTERAGSTATVDKASERAALSEFEKVSVPHGASVIEAGKPVRPPRKSIARPAPVAVAQVEAVVANAEQEEYSRPVVVKLMTDDPAVVIYWIVDQKGGSE